MGPALSAAPAVAAARYLATADRLLPGTVTGLYVVGLAALGAFRPGRSDVDLVAVGRATSTSGACAPSTDGPAWIRRRVR